MLLESFREFEASLVPTITSKVVDHYVVKDPMQTVIILLQACKETLPEA